MKITVLVENTEGSAHCPCQHGLSCYIETADHRILFDTGQDELLLENAERLGVDLTLVETVILSHGHYDHGGGLLSFLRCNHTARIYMQDTAFGPYYSMRADGPHYIGLPQELRGQSQIISIHGDHQIDENLFLLADIPVRVPIPSANRPLRRKEQEDYVPDSFDHEQCLLIKEQNHLYLFCGCAHHGIRNILMAVQELFHQEPDAVFGGFHLKKNDGYTESDLLEIQKTAKVLSETHTVYYTGHCTGLEPFEQMCDVMHDQLHYMHCGDVITL